MRSGGRWYIRATGSSRRGQEQFELTLDNADAARGLILRAYDAKNNSATARGGRGAPTRG